MSDLLKSAVAWKLAIFKGINGWFTVVAMTFIAGVDEIPGLDPGTLKIVKLSLACVVAGNKFVDGFLDTTVQNLRRSQDPLGISDTQQTNK